MFIINYFTLCASPWNFLAHNRKEIHRSFTRFFACIYVTYEHAFNGILKPLFAGYKSTRGYMRGIFDEKAILTIHHRA